MKIKLIDETTYNIMRAEVTDGRLEIDICDKTAEEVQEIFNVPGNLTVIKLLTDSDEMFGALPGWTVYGGVMLNGETKTAVLTKAVDDGEERITRIESNALAAKTAVEEQEKDIEEIKRELETGGGIENYNAVLAMARISAELITDDEQALKVQELYAEWNGGAVEYKTGTYLRYAGILYKVLKDHTSQETWAPDTAPSLYAKVLTDPSGKILPWEQPDSTNPYKKGDKVTHNGKTWISTADGNVWEPGAVGAPWEEIDG